MLSVSALAGMLAVEDTAPATNDPRHRATVVETRLEFDPQLHFAGDALHAPQNLVLGPELAGLGLFGVDRHHVHESRDAGVSREGRFEDVAVAEVAASDSRLPGRRHEESSATVGVENGRKN